MPFTSRAAPRRSSAWRLGGWGSTSGEASSFLRQWPATPDEAKTIGGSNYGGYNDHEFDKLIRTAIVTLDDAKRSELLKQAGTKALEGGAFIPLHFESPSGPTRRT